MSSGAIAEGILVREFTRELHNHNAAVFVGAGLSMSAGYVDWKGLLREITMDLKLDPEQESDLVTIAQYHCNNAGGRGRLSQVIFDKFRETKKPMRNHEILARLPLQTYWTTNYDKLLETALVDAKKVPDVKYTKRQLATTRLDRDVYVYKMHGDIDHPSDAVLSKDDYESYASRMSPFVSALKGDLIEKTFLFLGFSFTDPNIDYILSRVRVEYDSNQRHHYCIQRRVSKEAGELDLDFERRELKQEYFIGDLKRFGIQTVLVDSFDDITRLLERIASSYRRSSIFISGAANDYGSFKEPEQFLHQLSFRLASKRHRIISGFGLGVGDSVINGAMSYLSQAGKTISDEDLMLRPFPQVSTDGTSLADHWTAYRKLMIANAGIAIFVFGNKMQGGGVVKSNGMLDEFEICKSLGVRVLPVGCTGFMANDLWKAVKDDFASLFPNATPSLKAKFEQLSDVNLSNRELIDAIESMVDELKGV